jgi:LmbE family N-acetylglucosaminyl deacetylase
VGVDDSPGRDQPTGLSKEAEPIEHAARPRPEDLDAPHPVTGVGSGIGGHGEDGDGVPATHLFPGQIADEDLDPPGSRRVDISDMDDVERFTGDGRPGVIVALHAHPDDEALLTGGTLARAAHEGHRVVLVTATDGERGLSVATTDLAAVRREELHRAAELLGVARVIRLEYQDSGWGEESEGASDRAFAGVDPATVARRVTQIVAEERAELLLSYDEAGGYGHPDHLAVHRVGRIVAATTGVRLLEATVPRESLQRALRLAAFARVVPEGAAAVDVDASFVRRGDITHRVDVRQFLSVKQAALRVHASQAVGGSDLRTVRLLASLPRPLARFVLGREWYVDPLI